GSDVCSSDLFALRHSLPDRLAVAPLRLVTGRLPILGNADPEARVGEPDPIAGRRPVTRECLGRAEPGHGVGSRPRAYRTSRTSFVSPGDQRSVSPAARSS